MKKLNEILDFFRGNDCTIDFHGTCNNPKFDIICNNRKIIILENANETQLINFYNQITKIMKTNEILDSINSMNENELVELNNRYCQEINDYDNEVYCNDEDFFNMLGWDGLRVAQSICYGDYNYSHNWVTFDGYGNLQSYYHFNIDKLVEYPETMAEYIAENFEQFEDLF